MPETHAQPIDSDRTYSEFSDPRLVAIYDTACPIAEYETFYLELAAWLRLPRSSTSVAARACLRTRWQRVAIG